MLRELPFPNMFWPKRLAFLHQIEEIKMKTSGFCFKMSFCWYIFSLESAMTRLVGLAAPWSATIPWPNGHCSILLFLMLFYLFNLWTKHVVRNKTLQFKIFGFIFFPSGQNTLWEGCFFVDINPFTAMMLLENDQ